MLDILRERGLAADNVTLVEADNESLPYEDA
jgi:hypothetical protein